MSELENLNKELLDVKTTKDINKDIENIIEKAQFIAHKSVNTTLVIRNWLIGYRISEEEIGNKTKT